MRTERPWHGRVAGLGDILPFCKFIVAGVVIGLWALALWQSWECAGLYSDGAELLVDMVRRGSFSVGANDPRAHAVILTQAPALLAMKLGIRDLHWLARLYSFGLFGLPTLLYSLALIRTRNDAVVLATVIVAIAMVFMTTSFAINGEYNTAYAGVILAAVWLGTASRLRASDGLVLVAIAALITRCYEHLLYLGPLVGLMTLWAIARAPTWRSFAAFLHGVAVLLFFYSAWIAAHSIVASYGGKEDRDYLASVISEAWLFPFNIQLDLLLAATASLAVWGLVRPADLLHARPYLGAGMFVLLLALSPILIVVSALVAPPYSFTQQASRTLAGVLTGIIVLFIWLLWSGRGLGLPLLSVLRQPQASRRLVVLACAMLAAVMPWDITLTSLYARYLDVVRETIRTQSGVILVDDSLLKLYPRLALFDAYPASLSLVMRKARSDGLIVRSAQDHLITRTFDPSAPPDLVGFFWRD